MIVPGSSSLWHEMFEAGRQLFAILESDYIIRAKTPGPIDASQGRHRETRVIAYLTRPIGGGQSKGRPLPRPDPVDPE